MTFYTISWFYNNIVECLLVWNTSLLLKNLFATLNKILYNVNFSLHSVRIEGKDETDFDGCIQTQVERLQQIQMARN